MTIGIWYSNSPYGTGDLKDAANITISSGVATLSEEQTGNIGAGCCIEFTADETEYCVYIAPNRIGFDGGATEIKPGYKIEDNTSGATGIVRYVEVTSGTWGGTPAAAGYIYFEETSGTFGNNNTINIIKPTVSNSVATVDGTIQGNIGNGNTQFVVKKPDGSGDAADQTSVAVTSIHHVWASLAAAEGASGFTSANFLDETNLITAGVVAFLTCYYDHVGSPGDADTSTVSINYGTNGANNYLQIYTPVGGAESINSQRHEGVWDDEKWSIVGTEGEEGIVIENKEDYVYLQGLQIKNTVGFYVVAVRWSHYYPAAKSATFTIDSCILGQSDTYTGTSFGIYTTYLRDHGILKFINSIGYGFSSKFHIDDLYRTYFYYSTISDIGIAGLNFNCQTGEVKNCAVFNTGDDFQYTANITIDHCASDDDDTGVNGIDIDDDPDQSGDDWAALVADASGGDFTPTDGDSLLVGNATPLHSTEGIWRDCKGTERDETNPDIGAIEYVTDNIKSVSGITWANVKSIGGVAKADIKKVGDLDTTS